MEFDLGKKEKAPHQVIHFESPPKTRLRKKLEEEAEKIRKSKKFFKKTEQEARKKNIPGNQRRLDRRLAKSNLDKYRKLGEKRKEVK